MSVSKIRGFLLMQPKPSSLRVTGSDGEPQEMKLGRSYAKTAESIIALGSDLVEALDASGAVLRALRMSSADARRSDAAELPAALAADPHAAMLAMFAQLVHRAYEHATEIAFVKVVELADRLGTHIEAVEARLERTESQLRRAHDDLLDDAFARAEELASKAGEDGNSAFMDQMAGAFLSGQLQKKGPAAAAAATNGHKTNGHSKVRGKA